MPVLIVGLVLFLATHSLRMAAPRVRARIIAQSGLRAWLLPYTLLSIIGFVLIVWGYGLARLDPVILYAPPLSLRHLALLLLLPVFPLLIAAYAPGRIKAAVGHPMLVATILWGLAHLLANGTLADLLLFGGFAAWAAIDWASAVRRPDMAQPTTGRARVNDAIAIGGGLIAYGLFIGWLHQWLIGVPPL
ncbi:NnrU family protein [Nitratireductor soli]|uniref:NnrU family protein n=1 Tax=Nitratireductor soli TaxID=1670619 RepID=UPI00065E8150|nr:NnrU family protein [Nitratireductor soli]